MPAADESTVLFPLNAGKGCSLTPSRHPSLRPLTLTAPPPTFQRAAEHEAERWKPLLLFHPSS